MGKIHMKSLGFDKLSPEEQKAKMAAAKPMMTKMYAGQFVLSFLTAFYVVFVVTLSISNGVPAWMAVLFPIFAWLCFVVPTIGSALIWSNCDHSIVWPKFFSDIFANLVTILLIAGLAALVG